MLVQGTIVAVGVTGSCALGLCTSSAALRFEDKMALGTIGLAAGLAATCFAVYVARSYEKATLDIGNGVNLTLYKRTPKIKLANCPYFTDAHMAQFKKFPELTTLWIEDCPQLTKEGFMHLTDCKKLWRLHLDCEQIAQIPDIVQTHLTHNSFKVAVGEALPPIYPTMPIRPLGR